MGSGKGPPPRGAVRGAAGAAVQGGCCIDLMHHANGKLAAGARSGFELGASVALSGALHAALLRIFDWMNPLAGAFHKGVAIPYWNGHACATGIMPGPAGACFRDKAVGKAALGCTGKPKKDLDWYASEHCACQACGTAAPFTFQHNTIGGDVHDIRWTSFCHTRGIPHCLCGLVDMSIKDKKTCYDLW